MVLATLAANKATGNPLGLPGGLGGSGGSGGSGGKEEYSYNAKSNALLFSTFFILFGISLTGVASKCPSPSKTSTVVMANAFPALIGFILGFQSSDYPMGDKSKSHLRGFFMMFFFGVVPCLTQLYLFMRKGSRRPNQYYGTYAMMGLFGQAAARLSVDLNGWEGHEIHIGWHATTLALASIAFIASVATVAIVRTEKKSDGSLCGVASRGVGPMVGAVTPALPKTPPPASVAPVVVSTP